MTDLMFAEFAKYQVLPLDASVATRMVAPRPVDVGGRKVFTYSGEPITGIPRRHAPSLLNTSYTITADDRGAAGRRRRHDRHRRRPVRRLRALSAEGQAGLPLEPARPQAGALGRADALTPGKHTLEYDFKYDGLGFATLAFNNMSGLGRGGTGTLKVDGKSVATQTLEHTIPLILPWDETFDIGSDTGTPVDDQDYQVPFPFTGKIDKLTVSVDPPKLTPADVASLKAAEAKANDAQ